MPFNAPAILAQLHHQNYAPGNCGEKFRFNYPQPCSDQRNFTPNSAPDYSLTSHGNRFDGRQHPCLGPHPGNGRTVCRYCIAATENQRWFRWATTFLSEAPPQTAEHNRSPYYLTRLCRLCEYREELLLAQLNGQGPNTIPPRMLPTVADRALMADWPENRCKCEKRCLYSGVRCLPHRKKFWETMKQSCLEKRRHNRKYLINTEQDAQGNRVDATDATQQHRKAQRLHRACRCGADPVATFAEAVVMQCMCCEGIVHFAATHPTQPPWLTPPPNLPPNLELLKNSLTTPNLFSITGGWGNDR